ncbi:MAG: LacI family DNA-binding transcriptional regulator [Hamadaea sp.]|uniref:LacI family DNA-binding transcriptional regulator n=1 Tax=Hamadaea sp. TaxID=2024425 RepID=UPI001796D71C|nr:LacI family DNA-binding transcriptional regulator [Hamadaea sp.]NUR70375.1 LacI family DNA-binding transcriptional regulator [Hamadaea sp.]NUT20535.1 LacI family DNA-binding transcriptional regulator [Hamadaea sp.]
MSKRPSIKDVAARAGVSMATVSRVLSGDYPVSAQTRERVEKAVRELDYVVNAHARALHGVTAKVVALVVAEVTTPFFARIAAGVEEMASQTHRLCLICTTHADPDRELEVVRLMREQRADAVILAGGVVENDDYRERMRQYAKGLEDAGSCLVLCARPSLGPDFPGITVDYENTGGAHAAVTHLLTAGHRRILMIAGPDRLTTSDHRVTGYRSALAGYGVPFDPALVSHGPWDREGGYRRMRAILDQGTLDFTGIFAGNDGVAAGVLEALREDGKRVPEDFSLVGYDDTPSARDFDPPLTSVLVPQEELGRTAVKLATQRSSGSRREHVMLGTHLVVRKSVRPLH